MCGLHGPDVIKSYTLTGGGGWWGGQSDGHLGRLLNLIHSGENEGKPPVANDRHQAKKV